MASFDEIFKNVDKKTLDDGMQKATEFAKTPEGRSMIEKIKNNLPSDKDSLMKMLEQNPEMIRTIQSYFKS